MVVVVASGRWVGGFDGDTPVVRASGSNCRAGLANCRVGPGHHATRLVLPGRATVRTTATTLIRASLYASMANADRDGPKRTVDAVGTTIDIFEALHEMDGGTVTELADRLDFPKSSVYAYLTTLEEREFVTREGYSYRPSYRFISVAEALRRSHYDVYKYGRESAKQLAEETGEFVQLMVEEYDVGIHIFTASGKKGIYADKYPVGRPCPLHCNAAGKAILAHLPEEKLERIVYRNELSEITENTMTDPDELLGELGEIRETGVAFSSEEAVRGMRGVASPVLDSSGEPMGSLNISAPVSQVDRERFREVLPEKVVEFSNIIEINAMNERGYDDA